MVQLSNWPDKNLTILSALADHVWPFCGPQSNPFCIHPSKPLWNPANKQYIVQSSSARRSKKLTIMIIMGVITGSQKRGPIKFDNDRYRLKKVNFEAGICVKSGVERNPVNPGGRRKWLQFCGSGQLSKTDCNPRYFPTMKCFLAKPHFSTFNASPQPTNIKPQPPTFGKRIIL